MRATRIDLYVVLGVARSATAAELRRAYRNLALAHHPDRAGADSAAIFAGIADAYRVLSNPVARSAYDTSLAEQEAWRARADRAVHVGGVDWSVTTAGTAQAVGTATWKTSRPVRIPDLLPRVSGHIDKLSAARIAVVAADGAIDLHLNTREAATGGTAAIQMRLQVVCSTCGGVARPRGVWCRSCEHDGRIVEEVTVCIGVPPYTHPGTVLSLSVRGAIDAPTQVRVFVHGLRPQAQE